MRRDDKPFFLEHSFNKVHYDNFPGDGWEGRSPARTRYRDSVVEVDDIVGRIVGALRGAGQLENTLIFFTSDNGLEEDSHPDISFTPFRGGKGASWEGGVRVPGIAYWPGVIKAGRDSDGIFDLMDLHTTSLSIAGALHRQPTDKYVDGIDQTGFLLANDGLSNRQTVFMWAQYDFAAFRFAEFKFNLKIIHYPMPFGGLSQTAVWTVNNAPWT